MSTTNHKRFWNRLTLVNLALVAFLGATLRTKILFPLPFIEQKNLINAHSHFAFGAWVTLSFFVLFVYNLLPAERASRSIYQVFFWLLQATSIGMLLSFPFTGYGLISISFSTGLILVTYAFSWVFIKDLYRSEVARPVRLLALCALLALVVSSIGPFTLAYILSTKSSNAILYRDAIYTYLHFQYNGFFTLGVLALFFQHLLRKQYPVRLSSMQAFAVFVSASVIPSLFLSLLWHPDNGLFKVLAIIGCVLILASLIYFFRIVKFGTGGAIYTHSLATLFWHFAMLSFIVKTLLQMGTIVPELGNAVFGYRPIIIGFLHLVFLGFVSFYLLSRYIEDGVFAMRTVFAKMALGLFAFGIVAQEVVLMVQGIGLLLGSANPIYHYLLWLISLLLFLGATLVAISGRSEKREW